MANQHVVTLEEYNEYLFDDAVDAFQMYSLLSKCKRAENIYGKREDGSTNWDDVRTIYVTPKVKLSLRKKVP